MSLAYRKREKNYIAHLEKDHPRVPEEVYNTNFLFMRISDEVNELEDALERIPMFTLEKDIQPTAMILDLGVHYEDLPVIDAIMWELADVSNCVDYLFDKMIRLEARALGEYKK